MAGWIIFDGSEYSVAEPLVKTARLKAEGVEPDATAATLTGRVFGPLHELATYAAAAQRLRHEEHVDVEMIPARATPEAAVNFSRLWIRER